MITCDKCGTKVSHNRERVFFEFNSYPDYASMSIEFVGIHFCIVCANKLGMVISEFLGKARPLYQGSQEDGIVTGRGQRSLFEDEEVSYKQETPEPPSAPPSPAKP